MRDARFLQNAFAVLLASASLLGAGTAALASDARVIGVVERVAEDRIVVDSATIVLAPDGRVRGDADALSKAKVGYWAEADGSFTERGLFRADDVKIREDAPGASFADHVTRISLKEAGKLDASDHILRDPAVNEYVRKVGTGLVPGYASKEHEFSFEVIRDPTLNAFALPSGAIYVHTGLLARLDNEAQLGIVLGHEISHVTQRHGQRQYKAGVTTMIPAQIGAIVLGVQFQRRNSNPFQQFMVGLGLNLGLAASVNGYGRTLEDQADRVGLRYAVETGYDPAEGPKIWDTFNDVDGDEGKVENFFYGNHSTNETRKENLSEEIGRHYDSPGVPDLAGDGEAPPQASPRTRLVNEEIYQQTMLDLTRENAVEDFDLERYHLASKGFDRVLRYRPGDPVAHHYAGRILLATDESPEAPDRALQEYLKAVSMAPDYPDVHRDLGFLYARMGRTPDAAAHFRRYLELAPESAKDRKEVEKQLRKAEGA